MLVKNKRVLVTGGTGFLGSHIVDVLKDRGAKVEYFGKKTCDLTNQELCNNIISYVKPDYVINCAAKQGGIAYNREHPIEILEENARIGLNVIRACSENKVGKLVNVLASCSYPDKEILYEDEYFDGPPHESVFFHGMAKRLIFSLGKAYNKELGHNFVSVCLTNLYGPRANFKPESSKVVEATIRKVVDAKERNLPFIECWGTGKATREFMYAPDAAEAVVQALECYNDPSKPLNIGSNDEVSIKELVMLTCNAVGYKGEVRWLAEKGDGQLRKLLDTSTMRQILNVTPTHLYVGLKETIIWYKQNARTIK